MKKLIEEFKQFAVKGNVIDMAVGVVIGSAFGKIVSSFVNDIITPLIGIVAGKVDFTSLSITIGESAIMYGSFIQAVFDFLIIAISIFAAIKAMNKLKRHQEVEEAIEEAAAVSDEVALLTEIRDLLKK